MIKLEQVLVRVGEPYPLNVPTGEGAVSDFLRDVGNRLIVTMPNIDKREAKSFKKGSMTCGLLAKNGAILLLWQFFDEKGRKVTTLDSPFQSKIIPDINLHNINSSVDRLLIDVHVVDTATNLVKGLRAITMPPELTLKFLSAVQDQLAHHGNGEAQIQAWQRYQPEELTKTTAMYIMGQ